MKKFFCNIIYCFVITVTAQNSLKNKIDSIALKEIKQTGIPSIQIAIGYDDKIIYSNSFGFANIENNVKASIQSKYRTASVSKWFTATLAMKLAIEKKIDLDTPIQNYCPHFPTKQWNITTRHLLTHVSGIRHYKNFEREFQKAKTAKDSNAIEFNRIKSQLGKYTRYTNSTEPLENFKNDSLLYKPNTNWNYSSFGYRLLGCILSDVMNTSYKSLLKYYIFDPAKMKHTTSDDSYSIINHRVSGYRLLKNEKIRRANMRDVSENLPAGGHLSTAEDLIKFAQAFQQEKFFSNKVINQMQTPYLNDDKTYTPSWRDAIPTKEKYGYGLMIFHDKNEKRYGHTGRQAGASSIVITIPSKKIYIAVLTNIKGWRGYISFTKKIEKILCEHYHF
ncbi:serine hydrolase domain-containing protein [Tenacibaculum sp. 190524A02b]|uniref:Serine beta-lactamase-like protein LACTB, mitochondrial n=1 Tax=Tenacibaculum vairaonense TaxID=3137860 RepID=A0ABM9PRD6_9FLAO